MKLTWARAASSHPALSGVSRVHFGELLEVLAAPWEAARESALRDQRGGSRHRSVGAGRKSKLVFVDRLLATHDQSGDHPIGENQLMIRTSAFGAQTLVTSTFTQPGVLPCHPELGQPGDDPAELIP